MASFPANIHLIEGSLPNDQRLSGHSSQAWEQSAPQAFLHTLMSGQSEAHGASISDADSPGATVRARRNGQARRDQAADSGEARYRALFGAMSEGVVVCDVVRDEAGAIRDYVVTDVNPAYERILGVSRDEALGRYASEISPQTGRAPFVEVIERVLEDGEPELIETEFVGRYFEISLFGLTSDQFGATFKDVTERVEAQQRLECSLRDLAGLTAIAGVSSRSLKPAQLWPALCDALITHLYVPSGLVFTFDRTQGRLALQASWGISDEAEASLASMPVARTWDRHVFRGREPILCRDLQEVLCLSYLKLVPLPEALDHYLCVPLVAGDEVQGVLCLLAADEAPFGAERMYFFRTLGQHIGVAIANAQLYSQLRQQHERLQTLSRRLVDIQESERRYIAQELHDEAGQAMTSIMVGLRLLEQQAHNRDAVQERVEEMRDLADGVMDTLHRLAEDLRPVNLHHLGLAVALRRHVREFGRQHDLAVDFESLGLGEDRLSPAAEVALYRIVQEALTNVARHARAGRVGVLLERRDDALVVIVEDDGMGFDVAACEANGRLGLLGMRERAQSIGGCLTIESALGEGTTLFVEVPDDGHSDRG